MEFSVCNMHFIGKCQLHFWKGVCFFTLIVHSCFRFQPAPLYILDEVDAALDLNHTQNIGSMIKAHFPQSQFIVVSLKVSACLLLAQHKNCNVLAWPLHIREIMHLVLPL